MRPYYKPDQNTPLAVKKGFRQVFVGFHFNLNQFPGVVQETLVQPLLPGDGLHHAFLQKLGHLLSATFSSRPLNSWSEINSSTSSQKEKIHSQKRGDDQKWSEMVRNLPRACVCVCMYIPYMCVYIFRISSIFCNINLFDPWVLSWAIWGEGGGKEGEVMKMLAF